MDNILKQIEALRDGKCDALIYGDPKGGPFHTYFKVKIIYTYGGHQFRFAFTNPQGQEGSGIYYPLEAPEDLAEIITKQIARINAPSSNPAVREFMERRRAQGTAVTLELYSV